MVLFNFEDNKVVFELPNSSDTDNIEWKIRPQQGRPNPPICYRAQMLYSTSTPKQWIIYVFVIKNISSILQVSQLTACGFQSCHEIIDGASLMILLFFN